MCVQGTSGGTSGGYKSPNICVYEKMMARMSSWNIKSHDCVYVQNWLVRVTVALAEGDRLDDVIVWETVLERPQ